MNKPLLFFQDIVNKLPELANKMQLLFKITGREDISVWDKRKRKVSAHVDVGGYMDVVVLSEEDYCRLIIKEERNKAIEFLETIVLNDFENDSKTKTYFKILFSEIKQYKKAAIKEIDKNNGLARIIKLELEILEEEIVERFQNFIYSDIKRLIAGRSHSTDSKIIWNGTASQLGHLFYQLKCLKVPKDNKPFLGGKDVDLKKFIMDAFVDNRGETLDESGLIKYLGGYRLPKRDNLIITQEGGLLPTPKNKNANK